MLILRNSWQIAERQNEPTAHYVYPSSIPIGLVTTRNFLFNKWHGIQSSYRQGREQEHRTQSQPANKR